MSNGPIDALKRSSILLGSLYGVSQVAGLAKEIVVAQEFGATGVMDAFEIAHNLPQLMANFVMGGLGGALIPHAVRYLREGGATASYFAFLRQVGVRLVLVLGTLMALAYWKSYGVVKLLGPGLPNSDMALASDLLRTLLVGAFLSLLLGLMVAACHGLRRFGVAGLPGSISPLVMAVAVAWTASSVGIRGLAGGYVVGQALSLALLTAYLVRVRRNETQSEGPTVSSDAWRMSLAAVTLVFLGWSGGIINVTVDKLMASTLPAGRVAALGYGYKMMMIPIGLFNSVVGVALLPHLSAAAHDDDEAGQRRALTYSIRLLALLLIPAAVAFMVVPHQLVRGLYERRNFDAAATDLTSIALSMYAPAILFRSFLTVFVTLLYARHRTRMVAFLSLLTVGLNVLTNWWLMGLYGHGGVALSTSLVTFLHAAALLALVPTLRAVLGSRLVLLSLARATIGAGVMAVGLRGLGSFLQSRDTPAVVVTIATIVAGGAIYSIAMMILGGGEMGEVWRSVTRRRKAGPEA